MVKSMVRSSADMRGLNLACGSEKYRRSVNGVRSGRSAPAGMLEPRKRDAPVAAATLRPTPHSTVRCSKHPRISRSCQLPQKLLSVILYTAPQGEFSRPRRPSSDDGSVTEPLPTSGTPDPDHVRTGLVAVCFVEKHCAQIAERQVV